MKLYLAHPFDSRPRVREWELGFERRTGIMLVNPFYDTDREDIVPIDAGRHDRYEKLDPRALVERDLDAIRSCDGTVAVVDGALSYGTIMEIVYSYLTSQNPIYIVVTNGHSQHPWLVYHANKIFTSFQDFEDYITTSMRQTMCDFAVVHQWEPSIKEVIAG